MCFFQDLFVSNYHSLANFKLYFNHFIINIIIFIYLYENAKLMVMVVIDLTVLAFINSLMFLTNRNLNFYLYLGLWIGTGKHLFEINIDQTIFNLE